MKKCFIKKDKYFLIVCTIVVAVVGMIFSRDNIGLWIEDEFGYVGAAAYITGYDWSQLYSSLGYYGFGYGLFLIPAFWLFSSYQQIMIYASVLNTIFLMLSFLLAARLVRKLFPNKGKGICYIVAMVAVLYINNVAMTQMIWSENLNLLLYWCILNAMYNIFAEEKVKDYIIASVLCCFSIMVHMRNAAVILPCVGIFFAHLLHKKSEVRKIMLFGLLALVGAVAFFALKNYYQIHLYNVNNGQQTNDIGSQINSWMNMLNWKYVSFFINSFWAKLFYAFTSTIGLIGIGIISFFYYIYMNYIKKRKYAYEFVMMIWLGFSIFAFAFLMTVFSSSIPFRGDVIFYGRYYEPYIGFVLIWGIMYLIEQGKNVKWIVYAIVFVWITYKISFINSETFYNTSIPGFEGVFTFPCVTGIARYFNMGIEQEKIVSNIFSVTLIRMVILFTIIIIASSIVKHNKYKRNGLFAVAAALFIGIQLNDAKEVNEQMKYCKAERYENIITIADNIDVAWDKDCDDIIYYYHTETVGDPQANILALQFIIGKTPINVIDRISSVNRNDNTQYIILNKKEKEYDTYKTDLTNLGMLYVCETELFELYRIE